MKIEQVKKLSPIERLLYFVRERESIRLQKEAGQPKPWTNDEILSGFRFCNVRRMDDKVSKWLFDTWYFKNFNHETMLLNVALARFLNKIETLEHLGYQATWSPPAIIRKLREYRDAGNTVFNGAYMVRGNDGIDKIECVVNYYVRPLEELVGNLDTETMEGAWKQISESYGFGSFMAGQVVADLRWAMVGYWNDRMTWAPIGPGSVRGMNRLHSRELKKPLSQVQFLAELRALIDVCSKKLPASIFSRLEAHDFQNCLCEYDKMERTLFDNRSPKQKYNGVS